MKCERLMLMKQLRHKVQSSFFTYLILTLLGAFAVSHLRCARSSASGSERRRNIATTPNNGRSENHKDVAPARAFEEQRHKFN